MNHCCVSIIMPVFNGLKYIEESINSVLNQTFQDFELIIVDDGSTDGTYKFINKNIKSQKISIFRLSTNKGAAYARNVAISHSKGRYLAFLDSDDILDKNALEMQLKFIKNRKAAFIYGAYKVFYEDGYSQVHNVPNKVTYKSLLRTNPIKPCTVLIDRNCFTTIAFPIEAKNGREDYACWLSLLKTCTTAYGNTTVIAYYRIHPKSLSRNKIKMALYQFDIYLRVEKIGIFKSIYYTLWWAYYGVKKYRKDAGDN